MQMRNFSLWLYKHLPRFFPETLVAFALYFLIALIYFAPSSIGQLHGYIFNDGGDPQQFIWYLNWWPYALSHHINPFISHYVWYPRGYNFSWSTSIPTLGLIMAPVTLIGGAILSFNLIALASPVLAALSCFVLLLYITKRYLPSLLGGYLYGFSSYELGQLLGHPSIYAIALLPLLILLFLLVYRHRIRPFAYVIGSALLLAMQLGTSLEIFATFIIFSGVALVVFYFLHREGRLRLLACGAYALYSLTATLVIAAPFVYFLVLGHSEVPVVIHPLTAFSTNVANLFVPSPITLVGGRSLSILSRHFTGNISENGAYLGLPLLIILLFVTLRYWGNRIIRALILILTVIGIASFGPKLHLIGHIGTAVPLPWLVVSKLPLVQSALPDRFSLYFFLLVSIILALWLSQKATSTAKQRVKYAAVLIGILALIPNTAIYSWTKPKVPIVFQKKYVSRYIPRGSNVLILPFQNLGSGIYYQYVSGMEFTQSGGYVGFIPKQYSGNAVIKSLLTGVPAPNFAPEFVQFCSVNKVDEIIYQQGQIAPSVRSTIDSLHWSERKVGNSIVISVPRTT